MRSRWRASICCCRASWATRSAGAAWVASVCQQAAVVAGIILLAERRGPRLSRPISSPWLTSGTLIFTPAAFSSLKAGDTSFNRSISTTPLALSR